MSQTTSSTQAVQTQVMTWSATRLKTYLTCPRQFRYNYIECVPSLPTSPLVFGRTLHEALCFTHEYQMQNGIVPPIDLVLDRFDALWQKALEEEPFFREGAPSPDAHKTTGHEILRAFLKAPENRQAPLVVELAFEVKAGPYTLAGIIDRVDETEEGLVIVDFKSGTRKPKPTDLEGDLQFTLYAFALGQMLGEKIERVVHYHLRDGSRHEMVPGDAQTAWLLDEVLPFVSEGVARGDFAPRFGYWCNWCDFRELCRAENSQQLQRTLKEEG